MTWNLITDGSCLGNPGKGGWGFILTDGKTEYIQSGNDKNTTNNRMELLALINGLKTFEKENLPTSTLLVTMDSQYILKAIDSWLANWKRNNWKTSTKQPVKNQDLWVDLDVYLQKMDLKFEWIKGHSGHILHDRVDVIARCAATEHHGCVCK